MPKNNKLTPSIELRATDILAALYLSNTEMQHLILDAIREDVPPYAFDAYKNAVSKRIRHKGALARKIQRNPNRPIREVEDDLENYASQLRQIDHDLLGEIERLKEGVDQSSKGRVRGAQDHFRSIIAQAFVRHAYASEVYQSKTKQVKKSVHDNKERWADIARENYRALFPEDSWSGGTSAVTRALSGWEPPASPDELTWNLILFGLPKTK